MTGARAAAAKTALLLAALGAVTWLGGINVRASIGFSLLQFGTLEFKPNIDPGIERAVFSLVAQSSMVLNVAYAVLLVSSIVYLKAARPDFRREGWLMIACILFFAFVPVEIYTMVLDVRMWLLDAAGSNDLVEFRKLFIHRLAALSGVPMIALLSYYTAVALVIFRPLRRTHGERAGS
jgi:hypothetical protein